jgi:hypothetical protein
MTTTHEQLRALVRELQRNARDSSIFGDDVRKTLSNHAADAILALLDELATWKHEAMHGGHADQLRTELAASKEANRVALDALEELCLFQLRYVIVWHNSAYDNAQVSIAQLEEVLK